jgi:predicted RNA binding protein YcfA (HicA-like mRNA interferase family)
MRTAGAIIRRLLEDGWIEAKGRGSHRNFRHPAKPGKVTVPFHGSRDLPIGTIRSIERQTGLDLLPKR